MSCPKFWTKAISSWAKSASHSSASSLIDPYVVSGFLVRRSAKCEGGSRTQAVQFRPSRGPHMTDTNQINHPPDPRTRAGAPFIDRRTTPLGVLPRHLQLWMLISIAVVMTGIMAIPATRTPPRSTSASATPEVPNVVDANQQRIQEYEQQIQEQAQRLAAEQAELHVAKEALAAPPGTSLPLVGNDIPVTVQPTQPTIDSGEAQRQERAQRAYRSLFSDNVAFSRGQPAAPSRDTASQSGQAQATPSPTPTAAPELPSSSTSIPVGLFPPSLMMPPSFPPPAIPASTPSAAPATAAAASAPSAASLARAADAPVERTYRIPEGTLIETVLTNRLDGTFAGPVNCLVTTPVYAADREHLLIPAGARALADATAVSSFGQSRLAIAFRRLLLANGRRIDL